MNLKVSVIDVSAIIQDSHSGKDLSGWTGRKRCFS